MQKGGFASCAAILVLALMCVDPVPASAQSDSSGAERSMFPMTVQAGAGAWGGYTLGYLQEVIYYSVPFDGFSGGVDVDCRAVIIDVFGIQLGARGQAGFNYSSNADVSGLEFDLAADAFIGFDYIRWLKPYIFGGIMANSFGANYGDEWASMTGLGLRYGGGVLFDIFEFNFSESMRAVVSAGAELSAAHIFLMDPEYFFDVALIYHTRQLRIPIRISLFVAEGQ